MTNKMAKENIKIIFSIISLFLMIIPLSSISKETVDDYYRTLFIFLINRVIDMFFDFDYIDYRFFNIWSFINQWLGVFACALAFCSMVSEFYNLFANHVIALNLSLFVLAVSFVTKDTIYLIFVSYKTQLVRKKITSI